VILDDPSRVTRFDVGLQTTWCARCGSIFRGAPKSCANCGESLTITVAADALPAKEVTDDGSRNRAERRANRRRR